MYEIDVEGEQVFTDASKRIVKVAKEVFSHANTSLPSVSIQSVGIAGSGAYKVTELALARIDEVEVPAVFQTFTKFTIPATEYEKEREFFVNRELTKIAKGNPDAVSHVVIGVPVVDQHGRQGLLAERMVGDGDALLQKIADGNVSDFARHITLAVKQLHDAGFLHNDIKLDNVLFKEIS